MMIKNLFTILLAICVFSVHAQEVKDPQVEFTNTGVFEIQKIGAHTLGALVEMKVSDEPGQDISLDQNAYLEDAHAGDLYHLKEILGKATGEKIKIPKSGDTTIQLIFEAYPKKVKLLNFSDGDKTLMYGINLQKTAKNTDKQEIPKTVWNWINQAVSQSKKKQLNLLNSDNFFQKDSIKIVGYIKGYDKRAGFRSGIIYHANDITNEDFPTTVKVFEDGRFEATIEGFHPIIRNIRFQEMYIPFYAEPGMTIGLIIDWEEFLLADRHKPKLYSPTKVQFLGLTKKLNEELQANTIPPGDYMNRTKFIKSMSPETFLNYQLVLWQKEKTYTDSLWNTKQLTPFTKVILRNEVDLKHANEILDFAFTREFYSKADTSNTFLKTPTTRSYYDFLKGMDLNNYLFLISTEFFSFINRLEFSELVWPKTINNKPENYSTMDSVLHANFPGQELPLFINIAKLRYIQSTVKYMNTSNEEKVQKLKIYSKTFHNTYFTGEVERLLANKILKENGYELPSTAAAEVFRKLIEPHKGKVVVVDFWAEWCGPCLLGIENSLKERTKIKDNPNLAIVYVTAETETSEAFQKEYAQKNLMLYTHRIRPDDFLALRELFNFNGIPRYILVGENGKIKDDHFSINNLAVDLPLKFPKLFKHADFQ